MRVLLIEDDSATAQSIELMLSPSFYVYSTDEEGTDLGKVYGIRHHPVDLDLRICPGSSSPVPVSPR
jgi:two-component system cell cycle response regulator CtrA